MQNQHGYAQYDVISLRPPVIVNSSSTHIIGMNDWRVMVCYPCYAMAWHTCVISKLGCPLCEGPVRYTRNHDQYWPRSGTLNTAIAGGPPEIDSSSVFIY
jgi:hypothetical protein